MLARLRNLRRAEFWGSGDRPWYGSLGISAVFHVGLIVLLASLWSVRNAGVVSLPVETRWSPSPENLETAEIEEEFPPEIPVSAAEGGNSIGSLVFQKQNDSFHVPTPVPSGGAASSSLYNELLVATNLSEEVGALAGGSGNQGQGGTGDGQGDADGSGAGSGFFGLTTAGESVVFVVDASASMNHPHPSPAKTRFGKLKLELARSVMQMDEEQTFYVIFFNREAIPMPTSKLQPASPEVQKRFTQWVAGVRAGGETDPRPALTNALNLQPDVIVFLTDGSFNRRVRRSLANLNQSGVAIHTIAFGNRDSEELLREIAAANGGEYHFVP